MEKMRAYFLLPSDFDHNTNLDDTMVLFTQNPHRIGYPAQIITYEIDLPNVLMLTMEFTTTPPDLYNGDYYLADKEYNLLWEIELLDIVYYGKKE